MRPAVLLGKFITSLFVMLAYIPRPVSQWLGRRVGDLNYLLRTRAYQVTEQNLALCFPALSEAERQRLCHQSLSSTGQTLMETPATWFRSKAYLDSWLAEVHGEDLVVAAIKDSRPMLMLLPHFGNWELINPYFVKHGSQTGIYQPPKQPYLQDLVARARHNFGHLMVPTTRRGLVTLYRKLDEGEAVCVLPDQVPAKGIFVPFFGVDTLTDQLSGRLISKSGAVVLAAAFSRRGDGRFTVTFMEADSLVYDKDPKQIAVGINRTVEACVKLAPEQYQWEYKRFRERPPGELKLYRFGKPPLYH